jgi:hypothetical protein
VVGQLNAKFEYSDSGAVGYFLGFNVHRDRPNRKLYIAQGHYLKALLERFGMKDYIALAERQTGHKIRCIRSDGGGEFWSTEWTRYMSEEGIEHIRTPPDAHAQNGRVEPSISPSSTVYAQH